MKGVLLSIGTVLALLGGFVPAGQSITDRVVAVVNQEAITLSDVEKLVNAGEVSAQDRLERRNKIRELRLRTLESLIEEKLIDQEVKRSGVKVPSKDIEAHVEEIKRRNSATQEELEKALVQEGITLEGFKKQIEKKMLRAKLIQWAVKSEIKPSEKDLRQFYEGHSDLYRNTESYRPAHILFPFRRDTTAKEVAETKKKCEKVLEKIRAGEDFGEMALLYSQDGSNKDRGDLGYFKRGELLPVLEKEALRLKVGEVSGIVRTDFGFHILKLLDHKGGGPLPYEEVKEKVKAHFFEKEAEKAFREFMTTLKEKSVIEIKM
jgi:peptidyl-prolyl cis-trans isomerase SurA